MLWNAVRTSFDAVCQWINVFFRALFLTNGALYPLLILGLIGIAVFVFVVSMKFLHSFWR